MEEDPTFCPHCGQPTTDGDAVCKQCGALIPSRDAIERPYSPSELPAAGPWQRTAAALIDMIFTGIAIYFSLWLVTAVVVTRSGDGEYDGIGVGGGLVTALVVGLALRWRSESRGVSRGARSASIRVVNRNGVQPGAVRGLVRMLMAVSISAPPLGLGYIWLLRDRDKRAWHDYISGTWVVALPPRRSMKCRKCANRYAEGDRFCWGCGQPIHPKSFRAVRPDVREVYLTRWARTFSVLDGMLAVGGGYILLVLIYVGLAFTYPPPEQGRPDSLASDLVFYGCWLALTGLILWIFNSEGGGPATRSGGLRIIDEDGYRPGVARGLKRTLGTALSALPLGLGFLVSLRDPQARTWHDHFAGTWVVVVKTTGEILDEMLRESHEE